MKRASLVVLLVIVLAGWVGTLISRDAGYVLVSYGGSSLQTSLWVAAGLLGFLLVALYYGTRLLKLIATSGGSWREWRGNKQKSRSSELSARGMQFLMEGEYERAERYLISGAENGASPAINYIAAAEAASMLGKLELRESYLRRAQASDPGAKQAIAIRAAQMSSTLGDWHGCLSALATAQPSDIVVKLKRQAYLELSDWHGLAELLPFLKKIEDPVALLVMEKSIALGSLADPDATESDCKALFKKLSSALKTDAQTVLTYCDRIKDETEREAALRQAINRTWQPALVQRYGQLGRETLQKREKQSRDWLKRHEQDADLQLCLGRIYEASGERDRAREAFEKSIAMKDSREANQELALLLAFDGNYKDGYEHFRSASRLE